MQLPTCATWNSLEISRIVSRILLLGAFLVGGAHVGGDPASGQVTVPEQSTGQPPSPAATAESRRLILGTVIEQRKYSIRIASGDEDLEVAIPDRLTIDQRLDRPKLDFTNNLLIQELPGSQAEDAEFGRPIEFKLPLPRPLGLLAEFSHPNERRRLLGDNPKRLIRYRLLPVEELPAAKSNELKLVAEVQSVDANGLVTLLAGDEELIAELGNRDARLGGRSIADLKPFATEIEVLADWIDDRWVAQEILFRQVAPANPEDQQPRLLLLGDEVSLSYLHSLRRLLADKYSVHHPPENCRGTVQWNRLPLWLGPYRQPGYRWDTIVFNVGLGDLSTSESDYAARLKQAIASLKKTEARIVWLSTTPLPTAWEPATGPAAAKLTRDEAQLKVNRLNQIAREVLREFPEIKQIDLGSQVQSEQNGKLQEWFRQPGCSFEPDQSEWVAKWIKDELDD